LPLKKFQNSQDLFAGRFSAFSKPIRDGLRSYAYGASGFAVVRPGLSFFGWDCVAFSDPEKQRQWIMQFPLFRESVLYFRENAKWQGSRKCNASAGSAKPEL